MRRRIYRRTVLAGAGATVSSPALARFRRGGASLGALVQTITAINLSGNTFLGGAGSAGAVIGTATVTLSPSSPPASGIVWSISGTDASRFLINSSTGVLTVGASDQAVGSYSINITATNAAYTGSPSSLGSPWTISGVTTGLTVNQNVTRPLGQVFTGAPNDYPFANVIASVAGGPGNPGDYLVFWSSATGEASQRWYLNNSSSPPVSGLTAASNLAVPSVFGFVWNPSGSNPPTPPVTAFTLRFVNGVTSAVIATQLITVDVLNGRDASGVAHHARQNSFFPCLSQIGQDSQTTVLQANFGTGVIAGPGACPIVAGTAVQLETVFSGAYFPANNTVKLLYTIDDIPLDKSTIVTGPTSIFDRWTLTINTLTIAWNGGTGIPDGTHALGIILVDLTDPAVSESTNSLPYNYRSSPQSFIVANAGIPSLVTRYGSPQPIPTLPISSGPSNRLNSSKIDFVTWPGFPAVVSAGGTRNTSIPIPLPQSGFIPPASDPSSPMHSMSVANQRLSTNWFTEGLGGANPTEYIGMQRFFTTTSGGIYAFNYNAEQGQQLEGDYTDSIRHFNFDGPRDDNMLDQISAGIAGHDGTYWVVFELFGRIVKVTHDGTATTIAGGTTDRTKVGLARPPQDGTYTETDIDTFLIQVGTIVSPTFGDLRGINVGCWDLTDPVAGNSLIVPNPIDHYIAKVTGLAPGHGPVTMFRICGQDGGIGGTQVHVADNGGMVDGPATEFVTIGTSTVATRPAGSISGTTFTEGAGGSGSFSIGCPLHGSGITAGTLIISGTGPTWTINNSLSVGSTTITGSTPVAQLAGPYSVDMADGIVGPDPKGTLYIADYQNSRIVKLAYDSGSGSWTTASTLFGNQTGVIRWAATGPTVGNPIGAILSNSTTPINVNPSAYTGGVLTLVAATPVVQSGVDSQYGTISPGWVINLTGLTNSGSGGSAAVAGNFSVLTVTDSQHFTVSMPNVGGGIGTVGGTGSLVYYSDDVYLPVSPTGTPRAIGHGGAHEAYCPLPQRAIINSTGKLVIGNSWMNVITTVDLAANTIVYTGQIGCTVPNTRLNPSGDRGSIQITFIVSWWQIDVDRGVAGDVSSTGCCGPKDDIFGLTASGAGAAAGYYWRIAKDGTVPTISGGPGIFSSNDMVRAYPLPVGRQGGGHYNWAIALSRHQGRMFTNGLSDSGVVSWRIINPANGDFFSDTSTNLNVDGGALMRGYSAMLQGTIAGDGLGFPSTVNACFPWGTRPGIMSLHGEGGRSNLGLPGVADTYDGVINTVGPSTAALATYLKNGLGGTVPAPEFSEGGDDSLDCTYTLQRMSAQGSIPGGTTGGGFTAILAPSGYNVVQRAPYATDVTAPFISAVSATRTGAGATTITVTWTTDKPTWGVVCAGFANQHGIGSPSPYHLFAREAFVAGAGNPSYGTSHSVTIDVHQDVITYIAVVVKDIAGNNAISPEQTVAA